MTESSGTPGAPWSTIPLTSCSSSAPPSTPVPHGVTRKYDALLARANSTLHVAERLQKLAEAETYLLRQMPLLPIYYDSWLSLRKPYVRGVPQNHLGRPMLKDPGSMTTGGRHEAGRTQCRKDAAMSVPAQALAPEHGVSLWQDAWRRLRRNRAAMVGAVILLIVVASLAGRPWLVYLYNGFEYDTLDLDNRLANPTARHLIGTDTLGRDLLARVLYGSRISLLVGLVSTLISLIIGVSYGAVAGYFGGRVDEIMMRSWTSSIRCRTLSSS